MAISWSEDISSGAGIQKSNLAEIKTEIDNLADYLNVSLSWNNFVDDGSSSDGDPTSDTIKTTHPQELRDKTETINTNVHSAVYGSHYDGDNGNDYGTHESRHETGYDDIFNNSVT